jgi:alginate O-acetyltransferase complex protein AlgI
MLSWRDASARCIGLAGSSTGSSAPSRRGSGSNRPSRNFWRRWNISLSSWFRDYVYIPLGGSRLSTGLWVRNVLVTFLLSGLWHGASWNYVLWGLYHGVLLLVTQVAGRFVFRGRESGRWVVVPEIVLMFVLTNVGWLLFRETELSAIIRDLTLSPFGVSELDRETGVYLFLLAFGYSVPLWIQSLWVDATRGTSVAEQQERGALAPWPRLVLQGVACGLAFATILVFRSRTSLDFIYFQF